MPLFIGLFFLNTLQIQYFAWGFLGRCRLVGTRSLFACSRIDESVLGLKSVEELCLFHPMGIDSANISRLPMEIFQAQSKLFPNNRARKWYSYTSEAEFMNVQSWELSYLSFLYGFLKPYERGYGFVSGFPSFSFTVYSNWTVETVRGCESLKRWLWRARRKTQRLLPGFRPRIRPLYQ